MKLQRSSAHFPYRRYAADAPRYRAPLHRKVRRMMRNAAQMHDVWAWFYGILFIAILLLMEVLRCI